MGTPTQATDNVAHAAVALAAAIIVPTLIGKEMAAPVIAGPAGTVLHRSAPFCTCCYAPRAQVMADHKLWF